MTHRRSATPLESRVRIPTSKWYGSIRIGCDVRADHDSDDHSGRRRNGDCTAVSWRKHGARNDAGPRQLARSVPE